MTHAEHLIDAIQKGNHRLIPELLALNPSQEQLNTLLVVSAMLGLDQCVQALISVAEATHNNSHALRCAVRGNHTKCTTLLLEHSQADACNSEALWLAAERGNLECVNLLMGVSTPTAVNSRALLYALLGGHNACFDALLPYSDVNAAFYLLNARHSKNTHAVVFETLLAQIQNAMLHASVEHVERTHQSRKM